MNFQKSLDAARAIVERAEADNRTLTTDEVQEVESRLAEARVAKTVNAMTSRVTAGGNSLFDAFKAAGWAPGKRVTVAREHLKTATFTGDPDDLTPARREGAALGFDRRWLASVFPSTGIGSDVTSVQVFRQASRTLPAASAVRRSLLATTPKAEVTSARELLSEPVEQLAAKESGIPNALLAQDGIRSMVDEDLRLAILEAKDAAVVAAINAAAPATAGADGSDLTAAIVYAAAEMAEDGYSGTLVAISPMDYAAITLLRGADEQFARRDPLADFRFVPSKSIADGSPLLLDPGAAGHRFEGPLALQTFEENDGATNTSLVRLEQSFLFNVERVDAIRVVVPTPTP